MNHESQPAFEDTLEAYRYELPEDRIARAPRERGASRLMRLERAHGTHSHHHFVDLPELLPEGALLVANNSRVLPARLSGMRDTGGKMECLLLTPLPLITPCEGPHGLQAEVEGLIRPLRPARIGVPYAFAEGSLMITLLEKGLFGHCRLRLEWNEDLRGLIERHGTLPLPPYMRREADATDALSYQTIYAREDKSGSVAAPTAGLHFTPLMRERLRTSGFEWAELTLHVGYGTFSPVREQDVRRHPMHPEFVEIDSSNAAIIAAAKHAGRPIVAVGTTAARALEAVAAIYDGELPAHADWVNLFIRPGFDFRVLSGLITNFHLPESTLLMLVCALAGHGPTLDAYRDAVQNHYAFFSYGDAMLIC